MHRDLRRNDFGGLWGVSTKGPRRPALPSTASGCVVLAENPFRPTTVPGPPLDARESGSRAHDSHMGFTFS